MWLVLLGTDKVSGTVPEFNVNIAICGASLLLRRKVNSRVCGLSVRTSLTYRVSEMYDIHR